MDLISYFAVQHQMVIHHVECWTLSGFNCCLACFYALIELKKGSKFVSHLIADFNVMYQELKQNIPTVTYVFYHVLSTWMDICHTICVICCAVQLFSSNVAPMNLLSIPHQNRYLCHQASRGVFRMC